MALKYHAVLNFCVRLDNGQDIVIPIYLSPKYVLTFNNKALKAKYNLDLEDNFTVTYIYSSSLVAGNLTSRLLDVTYFSNINNLMDLQYALKNCINCISLSKEYSEIKLHYLSDIIILGKTENQTLICNKYCLSQLLNSLKAELIISQNSHSKNEYYLLSFTEEVLELHNDYRFLKPIKYFKEYLPISLNHSKIA